METEKSTSRAGVLRLRGLPFTSTEEDIKSFFQGYDLQEVFICKRTGRATGEAYVQLADEVQASEALKLLNRKNIGHRYIEIFEALESDLSAVKASAADSKAKGFVVRLRGLPYTASLPDVQTFFEGIAIQNEQQGVVFTYTPDGRPTGEAYVEFPNEDSMLEAMKRHKQMMATRYIELFASTKYDMHQAAQQPHFLDASRRRYHPQSVVRGPGSMAPAGQPYGPRVEEVTDMLQGMNFQPRPHLQNRYGPNAQLVPGGAGGPPGGALFDPYPQDEQYRYFNKKGGQQFEQQQYRPAQGFPPSGNQPPVGRGPMGQVRSAGGRAPASSGPRMPGPGPAQMQFMGPQEMAGGHHLLMQPPYMMQQQLLPPQQLTAYDPQMQWNPVGGIPGAPGPGGPGGNMPGNGNWQIRNFGGGNAAMPGQHFNSYQQPVYGGGGGALSGAFQPPGGFQGGSMHLGGLHNGRGPHEANSAGNSQQPQENSDGPDAQRSSY